MASFRCSECWYSFEYQEPTLGNLINAEDADDLLDEDLDEIEQQFFMGDPRCPRCGSKKVREVEASSWCRSFATPTGYQHLGRLAWWFFYFP